MSVNPDQDRHVFRPEVIDGEPSEIEWLREDEAGVGDGKHTTLCGKLV